MSNLRSYLMLVLAVALLLPACGTDTNGATAESTTITPSGTDAPSDTSEPQEPTTGPEQTGDPIKVGVSLPLTGRFSIPGAGHKDGYQFCVDAVNERGGLLGRPVELIVTDNQSDPQAAVEQYQRFISVDNVELVFGTFSTGLSFPVSAITEREQMVYPEPTDNSIIAHSRGFTYNFAMGNTIDYIGHIWIDALQTWREGGVIAQDQFPETAAILYQDDFFASAIYRGLVGGQVEMPGSGEVIDLSPGYLSENSIEIVFEEQFPTDYTDWANLANRAKASEADAVFVLTVPPAEVEVARAFDIVNYNPITFFSQGTYPEFEDALGPTANGAFVYSSWDPQVQWDATLLGESFSNPDFVAGFEEAFGSVPTEDMAQAFTACAAMFEAVTATGSTDNTGIRDWFKSRTSEEPLRTIQGPYYWDDVNLLEQTGLAVLQWQDGNLAYVFPEAEGLDTADPLLPTA